MTFFRELKRRKVYRVAVGYVVAAGGLIQLASAVFPAWELPNWALRLTVILLLIGFPIALVLAWAFDVTPYAIQATPQLALQSEAGTVPSHRRRNAVLLFASGVLISAVTGFFLLPRADADRLDKSIAVLPFENFSDQPENAHFADGIQDDILTNLSKIGDLKVISRTSVMPYRGKEKSVRQIGKELGVGAILEGSVRRDDKRVRVNVQLINAETDRHIWAEDYDRQLTDVFSVQTEIAQKIAKELNAHLSPTEAAQLTHKPTDNDEAYFAFREGHALQASLEDLSKLRKAEERYERAIALDPKFVQALANLSILHSWIYHNFEPTAAERAAAQKYAERALKLAPDSPEAHLAQGYSLYYGELDYDGALRELALAQRALPNDAHVYLVIGAIERRQGKWKESTAHLEKAVSLNPKDTWPMQNLLFNYQMQRNWKAAEGIVERALAVDPDSLKFIGMNSQLAYQAHGDLSLLEKNLALLDQEPASGRVRLDPETQSGVAIAKATIAFIQDEYQEAVAVVDQVSAELLALEPEKGVELLLLKSQAQEKLGQTDAAQATLRQAKEIAAAEVQKMPNDAQRLAQLAIVLARLGDKEAAVAEGKRATELIPISKDAFSGPGLLISLAQVYALTGEQAKALELVDQLLSRPSDLTVPLLRMDPAWESLRSSPGFEELISKHAPTGS